MAGHAAAGQPRPRFLDNVVTQTLAPLGDGRWKEYVGGYSRLARAAAADGRRLTEIDDLLMQKLERWEALEAEASRLRS
jgi:ATPase subunit of ABC transporter with duplicated ATPase domains